MSGPEDAVQQSLFPEDSPASGLARPSGYFDGFDLGDLTRDSVAEYGLGDGTLYRHSYLFQVEYPVGGSGKRAINSETKSGAIELRARTWSYQQELPGDYRRAVEAIARKAGTLFDTSIQTADYARNGGYLSGFFQGSYRPDASGYWEDSEMAGAAADDAAPGKIDWSVEIYLEDGRMSGIAQGLAFPWTVEQVRQPGRSPVHATPHKWGLTFNDSRGMYQVAPPGRSDARERYKPGGAGHDKTVYINGKPVGRLDAEGRTWLTPEYARGDGHTTSGSFGTYWSREGLVEETLATYQALRKGGNLYLTGETQATIDLRTKQALPEGYRAADPPAVSPDVDVRPGRDATTEYVLGISQPDHAVPLKCERDETVIRHLGLSVPPYTHDVRRRWSP